MRNIHDLKTWMAATQLSPEKVAAKINISNMTIRRLLKKTDKSEIPQKYLRDLNELTQKNENISFNHLMPANCELDDLQSIVKDLEKQGYLSLKEATKVINNAKEKLSCSLPMKDIKEKIFELSKIIRDNKITSRTRAVCLGSLLYFINPLDLINDCIPIIGYLDDFAILTLALNSFKKSENHD
jgi:uncharacterized membrane protein YkvA (DUF1232 family)